MIDDRNEIANHGYMHTVYSDKKRNLINIKRASDIIKNLFKVKDFGYASPGGIYTYSLAKALDELKFQYASNCLLGSEGFPYYPVIMGNMAKTLEIPTYLFCDACFEPLVTKKELNVLKTDYLSYIDKQLKLNEPIAIIGHPHFLGKEADQILPDVFKKVIKYNIPSVTMLEFNKMWRVRQKVKITSYVSGNTLKIISSKKNSYVEIIWGTKRVIKQLENGILIIKAEML